MHWHPESNPHFWPPQNQEQFFQSPNPGGPTPLHQVQHNQSPMTPVPRKKDSKRQDRRNQPLGPWATLANHQGQQTGSQVPQEQHTDAKAHPYHQSQHPQPYSPQEPQRHRKDHHSPPHQLLPPLPHPTRKTKCFAGFWACFWTVVILIGLVILVIYLLSRPHSPKFDVSNVTLNTAYLAPDGLIHADLTMQVKFTNPNRKVKMEFSYGVINLYYGRAFIASQNVEPFFFLGRAEYSLQVVQMVTSAQIQLPEPEMERLKKQLSYNAVEFEIKGVFHARSKLGSILRYSYRLHADCTFLVNAPPSGTLTKKYCKIKG